MCELQQPALLTPSPLLLRIPLAASRTLGKIKPVARAPAPCPWKRSDRRTQYSSNHIARISRRNVSLRRRFVPPRHLCLAKTKWRRFQEQPQHGAQRSSRGEHMLVCSAAFQRTHHHTLIPLTPRVLRELLCGTVDDLALWRASAAL